MNDKIRAQQYNSGAVFSFIQMTLSIAIVADFLLVLCTRGGVAGCVAAGLAVVGLAGVLKG